MGFDLLAGIASLNGKLHLLYSDHSVLSISDILLPRCNFRHGQDSTRTLWFGRDAFGRRSLLVHWPTLEDPRLLLSSVSPPSSAGRFSFIPNLKEL